MLQENHWHSCSYCLQMSLLTLDKTASLSKAISYMNVMSTCMYVCHVCLLLEEIIKWCKILVNWMELHVGLDIEPRSSGRAGSAFIS